MIDLLIEASVRSLVIAGLVAALLALIRPARGAVRHGAWTIVLGAMLISPLTVLWRPTLPIELPRVTSFVPTLEEGTAAARVETSVVVPKAQPAPAAGSTAGPATPARPRTPAPAPRPDPSWSSVLLSVWLLGVSVFAARMAIGWLQVRRLGRSARPVSVPLAVPIRTTAFECARVTVPVVVGLLRPRILLPVGWRAWSAAWLEAVLVHEDAHARRYDNLTTFVGQLNRCVFWFHPLAWWLESVLARSAEQACDDAVLDGARDDVSYADLLVTMAAAVRAQGARALGPAAAVAGGGRLESRIERILAGRARPLSLVRTLALGTGAVVVIVVGLACQQQAAPLRPNSEYTKLRAAQQERAKHLQGVEKMTRQDVEALEAVVSQNPDDLQAVERLLAAYDRVGQALFGWNDMVSRRRPVLERLVERHPDADAAGRPLVRQSDPAGYAAVERAWLAHVAKTDAPPKVLGNAAEFFRASDKPRSEALLRRAAELEPDGPQPRISGGMYYSAWRSRLGVLYAQAILGATDGTTFNVLRSFSVEAAQGRYAAEVRKSLETTTDAAVLTAAASWLMNSAESAKGKLPFDPHALGRSYVERALALDPSSATARWLLEADDYRAAHERTYALAREVRSRPAAFAELSDRDRFLMGAEIAHSVYISTEDIEKDPTRVRERMAQARRMADEALRLSTRFRDDVEYGRVVFEANCVLGLVALRDGDRRSAVEHLKAATATPGSPSMAKGLVSASRLPTFLLHAGERDVVIAFYEKLAELDQSGRNGWRKNAHALRAGEMTDSYQSMFGPKPGA